MVIAGMNGSEKRENKQKFLMGDLL